MRCLLVALATAVLSASSRAGPQPGVLAEKIVPRAAPSRPYALYVPSNYDAARKWPVLYLLDPRGRALVPMELFRPAAEELGYVVASSWTSASDGPIQPNVEAMIAMWDDTHAFLSIDDRRIYAVGFSGTARSAVAMATLAPGSIAGVVAAGAGYPIDRWPGKGTSFVYFTTVGLRDFNFGELDELAPKLEKAGVAHRLVEFEGDHRWMPAELARESLLWLDLRAMQSGTLAVDAARVAAMWNGDWTRAASLPPIAARRLYAEMASDYSGLHDIAGAHARATEIDASREYRSAVAARHRELRDERDAVASAQRVLTTARTAKSAVRDLRIEQLKKRTDDVAARILSQINVQTGFYLPREMEERKDWNRAALFLSIAAEIHPENPRLPYWLAAIRAKAGDADGAIASLERAVSLGFHDAARLEKDDDFASLRAEARFREIVAKMR